MAFIYPQVYQSKREMLKCRRNILSRDLCTKIPLAFIGPQAYHRERAREREILSRDLCSRISLAFIGPQVYPREGDASRHLDTSQLKTLRG